MGHGLMLGPTTQAMQATQAATQRLREALNESDLAAARLHDRASKRVLQLAEPPEVGVGPWGGPFRCPFRHGGTPSHMSHPRNMDDHDETDLETYGDLEIPHFKNPPKKSIVDGIKFIIFRTPP